jgi:hypothetical protein
MILFFENLNDFDLIHILRFHALDNDLIKIMIANNPNCKTRIVTNCGKKFDQKLWDKWSLVAEEGDDEVVEL